MKWFNVLSAGLMAWPVASAIPTASKPHDGEGSGPYPAYYFSEPTLENHTIYMPKNPPNDLSLPVLVWAEGGCDNNGTQFPNFLTNIASYGFVVVANSPINGSGSDIENPQYLRDSVLWISAKAGTCGKYKNVDASKVAAAGQSCGVLEAYTMRNDLRVSYLGIFNSGFLTTVPAGALPANIPVEPPITISHVHKPTFYFLGGPTDIAYPQGEADYHNLTDVPKWVGNYPVGHSGTYAEVNGGAFGVAAVNWLTWIFKDNTTEAKFFTEGGAEKAGWNETESYDLKDLLKY